MSASSESIQVLILEDAPMSALLLVKMLQKEGFQVEHSVVDNPEDLEEELENNRFEIVLSDYYMPRLNCTDALASIRAKDPSLPFIIVSGKIGEETVVEMMRNGATDFVMKDRMDRLVPVVQRELRSYRLLQERLKTQEHLQRTEEKYRKFISSILEVIPDGLIVMNESNLPFLINQSFTDIVKQYATPLGYSESEMSELLIERSLAESKKKDEGGTVEIRITRKPASQ